MQKETITVTFTNNAPFINCISKVNAVQIDNTKDLDVAIPMYKLLQYSNNYRYITGNLWSYYRDKPSSFIYF